MYVGVTVYVSNNIIASLCYCCDNCLLTYSCLFIESVHILMSEHPCTFFFNAKQFFLYVLRFSMLMLTLLNHDMFIEVMRCLHDNNWFGSQ